jgi:hypothetical protein
VEALSPCQSHMPQIEWMKDQNVTYMLKDQNVILLNKFNFKQVGTLQEIVVEVGMDEV